jgi:hypothetical protein
MTSSSSMSKVGNASWRLLLPNAQAEATGRPADAVVHAANLESRDGRSRQQG